MMDKFTQFLGDKFLYDQVQAMELLVVAGLKEQLFDLAKVGMATNISLWSCLFLSCTSLESGSV